MSADESMDRRAVDGAAAPWREPELGVQLTEEAREYEAMLCSRETQRIYGGQRHGRSPAQGLATLDALLAAPPDCRLVATRRGVFFEIRVLDHPGRIGQETIVHLRWVVYWDHPSDYDVARCDFYAPRQSPVMALSWNALGGRCSPSNIAPPEEFETQLREMAVNFPRYGPISASHVRLVSHSIEMILQEVGRTHGGAAKAAVASYKQELFSRLGVFPR